MENTLGKLTHVSLFLLALWKINMLKGQMFLLERKVKK